jgi:hypothetical protein
LLGAVLLVAAGCAEEVSPAIRVDDTTISHDDLLAEVAHLAASPTLTATLVAEQGIAEPAAPSGSGYSMGFVDFVLNLRIGFTLTNAEVEARGLEVTDEQRELARSNLVSDDKIAEELDEAYLDRLVDDLARSFAVSDFYDAEYPAWVEDTVRSAEIEVSPRYGTWDADSGSLIPPSGPVQQDAELVER